MPKMNIFSSLEYKTLVESIFSKHRSVQSAGFKTDAYKPGLERMETFDKLLGSPSASFSSIHVAGTNGKGSVCHMLASALSSTGLKVGLYTSPHLLDFRERARIVSQSKATLISENDVWVFLTENRDQIDRLGLSFFEITTGMAFWWFAKETVDIAIIETGLGGRLDSTNILTQPKLSIISSIGLDHCEILGPDRKAIAFEKAGIFKSGSAALVGIKDSQTCHIFEERASEMECPLSFADDNEGERIFHALGEEWLPEMDLRGEYQKINLRTVLRALGILGFSEENILKMKRAITHAATFTGLRGRWEILSYKPLTIADIGHNPPALEWNFTQLREMQTKYDKLLLIYGVMADKAVDDILPLLPSGDNVCYIFTTPDTPRAMKAESISEKFIKLFPERYSVCISSSVAEAIDLAIRRATDESLVYIGGSTFVVADALAYMTSISDSLIHP